MDFFELNAFLTLSKTLHFAKTAEKINLSPSALSRLITRLEDETSCQLFERNNREATLTEKGKKFAEFAEKCLQQKEDVFAKLNSSKSLITGTLKVYASVTACYSIMPPFLQKVAERFPDLHLNVQTGDPAGAIQAVKNTEKPM